MFDATTLLMFNFKLNSGDYFKYIVVLILIVNSGARFALFRDNVWFMMCQKKKKKTVRRYP